MAASWAEVLALLLVALHLCVGCSGFQPLSRRFHTPRPVGNGASYWVDDARATVRVSAADGGDDDVVDLDAPIPQSAADGPSASDAVTAFLDELKAGTYSGDVKSMYPFLSPDFLSEGNFDKTMKTQPYNSLEYIARFEVTSALSLGEETMVRTRVQPTNLPPGGPKWIEFAFKVKDGGIRSFEPVLDDETGWVRAPKSGGRT